MVSRGTALAALVAVLVVAACGPGAATTGTPPPGANASDPATGPNPPPGEAVRFDDAILSEDGTTLTLRFTGGKEFHPQDPCSRHYFGWASEIDGVLNVKIVDNTPSAADGSTPAACDAIGYGRTITITLERPFTGDRIHDLAGYDHLVRRPSGAASLTIPAGWTPLDEADVEESPTGRWRQSWTNGQTGEGGKGRIDLYQAFGGPAGVTGGEEIRQVEVGGVPATLYRFPPNGELVLVWMLDGDGLALVVNEADFPIAAAIELAETATVP